jgi:hypothetical protein
MKKIIITLLSILLCCSFLFAEDVAKEPVIDYTSSIEDFSFQPTMSRYNAMGQSGLAAASRTDSFYTNPAILADKRFGLSVPSISMTMYNVQKIVANKEQRDLASAIISGEAQDSDNLTFAEQLVKNLGNGYNVLAKLDASVGLAIWQLGFGTNAQVKLHTLANGSSNLTNTTIIPEVNLAQTVGFGMNIIKTDSLKLQAGVSAHFVYKAYLKGQNAKTVAALISEDDSVDYGTSLLWNTPLMAGYATPIDLGVTLSIVNDAVRFSATANNLNGLYHMKSYTSVGDYANTVKEEEVVEVPEGHVKNESTDFEISTPWTLNVGFAFAPNVIFSPVVTVDVVDVISLFDNEEFRASDILLHLNAGAEVTLAIFNLRAGINRGYATVGVGFGFIGMRVDATYGWQEFGTEIGDKPVDSLTIRFNLGYDK